VAERVALVTRASRGIGRATTLALARTGHRVDALARSRDLLVRLAAEEPRVEPLEASIDTAEGCADAIEAALRIAGPPAILVNNAGRGGWHNDRSGSRTATAGAQEVAAHGITCNAVLPGWAKTETATATPSRRAPGPA
jgi:NAD(P)-dependent dehydrogenase (short-subunit alcohol dehydrogenase family)